MIYALVPDELPPRALPGCHARQFGADARAAVLEAFEEPGEPDSVSLSFNGTALEDDKPLSEYGVEIHALVRAELSR